MNDMQDILAYHDYVMATCSPVNHKQDTSRTITEDVLVAVIAELQDRFEEQLSALRREMIQRDEEQAQFINNRNEQLTRAMYPTLRNNDCDCTE